MSLVEPFAAGILLGLSLAAPPGPINVLMAARAARDGWWSGARVGFGAATADTLFLLLAWFGAIAILARFPDALAVVSLVGAGLMFRLAWGAWRAARTTGTPPMEARSGGWAAGFAIAATSPYNFAWWLGAGTSLLSSLGPALAFGFVAGVLLWVATFPAAVVAARRRIPSLDRWISLASAVILAAFAGWLAWSVLSPRL